MPADLISKSPSTHATLLLRLRQTKNGEAWTRFVHLYTPLVYRYCRLRGLQDADSRDVTQQVFSIVHGSLDRFHYDPNRGRFRNWLGAVTAHEISRHTRKQSRPGRGMGAGWGDELAELCSSAPDADWLEELQSHLLKHALATIRPEFEIVEWEAFELTWLRDVNARSAGEKLGKPAAWIYKARYKVIERLRRELELLSSDAPALQRQT